MIQLSDIQICFRRDIITQGEILIYPHQITLLTGISGCGKSSLLNILALLDKENHYQYRWDDHVISFDDYERMRQYNIAYVLQDYNLIYDLDIEDNFKAAFQIAGIAFDKQRMCELLQEVSLSSLPYTQRCKSLSGGEKQRLAIALALIKEPKLLLLDEPTANLDEENSEIIVQILHQIKQRDIMIVIASHHPDRYHADHVYQIEDLRIIETQSAQTKAKNTAHPDPKERLKFHHLAYAKLHFIAHFALYSALMIAMIFSFYQVHKGLYEIAMHKQYIDETLEYLSADELMVNHTGDPFWDEQKYVFSDIMEPFTHEAVQEMASIPHVRNVYPYFVLTDFSYPIMDDQGIINDAGTIHRSAEEEQTIVSEIVYNDQTINTMDLFLNELHFISCDEEQKMRQSIIVDEQVENGVFISKKLADALQIEQLNHTTIRVFMPILTGYVTSTGGSDSHRVDTFPLSVLYRKMDVEIQGIYEECYENFYNHLGGENIYIDYRTVMKYHDDLLNDEEVMKQYRDVVTLHLFKEHDFYVNDTSSSYIVQVDDPQYTEEVYDQIYHTFDRVYVKGKTTQTESLYQSLEEVAMMTLSMPLIILGIMLLLMSILYLYILHARKKEIAYLQVNGIQKTYLIPFINQATVILLACVIGFLMAQIRGLSVYVYDQNKPILVLTLIMIMMLVLILLLYYVISYFYFKHMDMKKELHSK